ncbi:MAG TPA: 3-hydroxyisobutyrate dehydrogenase [Caulobacteraceae bacterium]|jgi:3-hydroxyisobutyrate dehydrogenase
MGHVAFLGVGAMGLGMATRLAGSGQAVVAYDVSAEALARAVAAGCTAAGSASEAVRGADVVITMLATGAQVASLYADVIVPNAAKGALAIDCSTIDVETARTVAALAAAAGLRPVDAPVSGGTMAAEAGTLAFMVGCDEPLFEIVRQALSPMARVVIHAGGAGAGQAAKICNNMVLGISMLGVCEAFGLAEKLGLAPERFFEIASQSSGQCWSLTTYCPWPGPVPTAPSNRGYEGGFLSALMLKDLKLAQEAAAKSGASTPLGAQAEAIYALFDRLGYGRKDFSAVLQLLRGSLDELA